METVEIPQFQLLDKVVHGFPNMVDVPVVMQRQVSLQRGCLRMPWKNSTHFLREDARAVRTETLDIISRSSSYLAATRVWTKPPVPG